MLYPGKQRPCPKALALAGQALFVLGNTAHHKYKNTNTKK